MPIWSADGKAWGRRRAKMCRRNSFWELAGVPGAPWFFLKPWHWKLKRFGVGKSQFQRFSFFTSGGNTLNLKSFRVVFSIGEPGAYHIIHIRQIFVVLSANEHEPSIYLFILFQCCHHTKPPIPQVEDIGRVSWAWCHVVRVSPSSLVWWIFSRKTNCSQFGNATGSLIFRWSLTEFQNEFQSIILNDG